MREVGRLTRLKAELAHELERLDKLQQELAAEGMEEAHPRIIGSILHDFYTGVERIFIRIAEELGEGLPRGEHWHRDLLLVMTLELEGIRPARRGWSRW
jgi:hypothetical protein